MVEIAWSDLPDPDFKQEPTALTIGVFDGIHVGHQRLLAGVTGTPGQRAVVVTFQRHPTEILALDSFPGFLMSLAQKRHALQQAGVNLSVLIDFSLEFSRLSGPEFLDTLLTSFAVRRAVLGHDFRCGHKMGMDAPAVREYLALHGVAAEIVEPVRDAGVIVSSTGIREAVTAGMLAEAGRLLGRPFTLDITGEVVESDGPESWIELDDRGLLPGSNQILPPPGTYPGTVQTGREMLRVPVTIGKNSIRLPLAADQEIRYIVLQENRLEDKEKVHAPYKGAN